MKDVRLTGSHMRGRSNSWEANESPPKPSPRKEPPPLKREAASQEKRTGERYLCHRRRHKRKKISSEVSEVEKSKIEGKKATAEYNATWERGEVVPDMSEKSSGHNEA